VLTPLAITLTSARIRPLVRHGYTLGGVSRPPPPFRESGPCAPRLRQFRTAALTLETHRHCCTVPILRIAHHPPRLPASLRAVLDRVRGAARRAPSLTAARNETYMHSHNSASREPAWPVPHLDEAVTSLTSPFSLSTRGPHSNTYEVPVQRPSPPPAPSSPVPAPGLGAVASASRIHGGSRLRHRVPWVPRRHSALESFQVYRRMMRRSARRREGCYTGDRAPSPTRWCLGVIIVVPHGTHARHMLFPNSRSIRISVLIRIVSSMGYINCALSSLCVPSHWYQSPFRHLAACVPSCRQHRHQHHYHASTLISFFTCMPSPLSRYRPSPSSCIHIPPWDHTCKPFSPTHRRRGGATMLEPLIPSHVHFPVTSYRN